MKDEDTEEDTNRTHERKTETNETRQTNDDEDDKFDGLEGTYNLSSTYFDVFDNLMRKYVGDLNVRDELQA